MKPEDRLQCVDLTWKAQNTSSRDTGRLLLSLSSVLCLPFLPVLSFLPPFSAFLFPPPLLSPFLIFYASFLMYMVTFAPFIRQKYWKIWKDMKKTGLKVTCFSGVSKVVVNSENFLIMLLIYQNLSKHGHTGHTLSSLELTKQKWNQQGKTTWN